MSPLPAQQTSPRQAQRTTNGTGVSAWLSQAVSLVVGVLCLAVFAFQPAANASRPEAAQKSSSSGPTYTSLEAVRQTLLSQQQSSTSKEQSSNVVAEVTSYGHWQLMNLSGETFMAASPEEFQIGLRQLIPAAMDLRSNAPKFYLTPVTVFDRSNLLATLPRHRSLTLVIEKRILPLKVIPNRKADAKPTVLARLNATTTIAVNTRSEFEEVVWQADRSIARAQIRVLTLKPDHPTPLPASRTSPIDQLIPEPADPYKLVYSLKNVSGQTIILSGKRTGKFIYFRPPTGDEQSVLVREVEAAARAADVNLIIVGASSSRQPGARNMLLQLSQISGLGTAASQNTFHEMIGHLAGTPAQRRLSIAKETSTGTDSHLKLVIAPAAKTGSTSQTGPLAAIKRWWQTATTGLSGDLGVETVSAVLRTSNHELEMGRRLVNWLPSWAPFVWLGFALVGLIGATTAWRWWSFVWPEPVLQTTQAANPLYYLARLSQLVKRLAFFTIALPIMAVPAIVAGLVPKRARPAPAQFQQALNN